MPAPGPPAPPRARVLILSPDPARRGRLAAAFGAGWAPVATPDPRRALAVARTFAPRLVVAAGPEALGLLGGLRADLRTGHLPVLALADGATAQTDALERGADAALPLAPDPDLLRATAYRLVATREELRQRWSHRAALALEAAGDSTDDRFLDRVRAAAKGVPGGPAAGSVLDLAEAVHLSPRQLTRRLKALTGESPGAFLRRTRLGRAAAWLRAGASVKEAAEAAGYSSRSQFGRAFREAFGADPSAFAAGAVPGAPHDRRTDGVDAPPALY